MFGYPQFSFWIPTTLAKTCFSGIVINRAKEIQSFTDARQKRDLALVLRPWTRLLGGKVVNMADCSCFDVVVRPDLFLRQNR